MENLEKSWNIKMVISRLGKALKKYLISKRFEKVMENVLYSYVHLRSLIKRIKMYINIYSFVLFKVYLCYIL